VTPRGFGRVGEMRVCRRLLRPRRDPTSRRTALRAQAAHAQQVREGNAGGLAEVRELWGVRSRLKGERRRKRRARAVARGATARPSD
jgi:hypothetical protein